MRYDFLKKGDKAQWVETRDGVVRRASERLAMFGGQKVEVLLAWCCARHWRAYVSHGTDDKPVRMDLSPWSNK